MRRSRSASSAKLRALQTLAKINSEARKSELECPQTKASLRAKTDSAASLVSANFASTRNRQSQAMSAAQPTASGSLSCLHRTSLCKPGSNNAGLILRICFASRRRKAQKCDFRCASSNQCANPFCAALLSNDLFGVAESLVCSFAIWPLFVRRVACHKRVQCANEARNKPRTTDTEKTQIERAKNTNLKTQLLCKLKNCKSSKLTNEIYKSINF